MNQKDEGEEDCRSEEHSVETRRAKKTLTETETDWRGEKREEDAICQVEKE